MDIFNSLFFGKIVSEPVTLGGGGGVVDPGSTVDYLPVVWLCFSAFLSLKESLLTTVL